MCLQIYETILLCIYRNYLVTIIEINVNNEGLARPFMPKKPPTLFYY